MVFGIDLVGVLRCPVQESMAGGTWSKLIINYLAIVGHSKEARIRLGCNANAAYRGVQI